MKDEAGVVKVAPEVLVTVARRTVLAVPGVAHLGPRRPSSNPLRVLHFGASDDGIDIAVEDNRVTVDLSVVVEPNTNITQVGKSLQQAVKRAIEEIVGMPVAAVNIHIDDVSFAALEA
ncbi:MAG: Asp23/Gls24 family envelope stress response protein [Ardenticatenaceae bacterium]|nr:Asp23/Gls24 family envelope stress response protein [Ardenticatenaceae bacterium]